MSIRLPKSMWDELDEVAEKEDRSRNEVVEYFLRWAIQDWRRVSEGTERRDESSSEKPKRK